ncbi:autotransporter outer membrane beta-barrel domain-containing protein [Pseudomonas protegens]|uniref:autotransporter outer membrane beta-barrel domain-containing protein n=1 Tax=Pseudomonas protegens TaxID=380021 RepID=UPI00227F7CFA|nr:autotransporter outer membrane beta-barrel domain-containing protein [Pseudomonas protegens]MCY7261877.1 autotransporter outer membrane beta-barrel domain-containing protein [Pseudomonas protegens]
MSLDGIVTNAGATSDDIGSRNSSSGQVTLGYGVDGKTTIGATLNISATNLSNSGFEMGANNAASVWAEYSESGLAGTGLQANTAIGKGQTKGKVARGRDLENVMLATGNASLETFFAQASLGYGIQIEDWLVTPTGTLTYYDTSRSAYTEKGSDFNADYDRLSMKRTTATLEFVGERHVLERGTLSLGGGVEHDLKADRVALRGTSDLPGVDAFEISSALNRHQTRGFATVGYSHDLGSNQTISGAVRTGQSTFGNSAQTSVALSYGVRF